MWLAKQVWHQTVVLFGTLIWKKRAWWIDPTSPSSKDYASLEAVGLFFFNMFILGDPHAKKGSHQTKALQSSYGLEVIPRTFFYLKIVRQNDTNNYENQNLCVNHFLHYISKCLQADQRDSNHILSPLFSCVGPLPFPCSARLGPSTLRRTMVFAFWGCSKSNSSNGLSSTSLT